MTAGRVRGSGKRGWGGRRYAYGVRTPALSCASLHGAGSARSRHREGSRGAPGDLAVDLGVGGALAEPDGLAAAVVVAGPGRQQAQVAGEPAQPGPGRLVVVHVVDLDAVEAGWRRAAPSTTPAPPRRA